jgi:predicted dienelactone hydrolase
MEVCRIGRVLANRCGRSAIAFSLNSLGLAVDRKETQTVTPVLGVLLLSLLAVGISACAGNDSNQPVDPPDELGGFGVGHTSFTPVDVRRDDRPLLVDVWYPVDAEDVRDSPRTNYPLAAGIGLDSEVAVDDLPVSARQNQTLLVFSHGYGGINTQSVELMETLASHGFVVASPEHTGNAQASLTDEFDEAAANRVPDVSFLIDAMLARDGDPEDDFYDRIDENRVGVVGHSFGGMTAIGMAAGWAGAGPDSRVAAIASISAVIDPELQSDARSGPNAGFDAQQLSSIAVPIMLIGGTEDTNVPIGNNEIAFEQITSAPRVYKVDVIGATHTHFASVCAIGNLLIDLGLGPEAWPELGAEALVEPYEVTCTPEAFPIEEAIRLQNLYVVSFFKRHLLNQEGYDQYLSTDYADGEPAIVFSVK